MHIESMMGKKKKILFMKNSLLETYDKFKAWDKITHDAAVKFSVPQATLQTKTVS